MADAPVEITLPGITGFDLSLKLYPVTSSGIGALAATIAATAESPNCTYTGTTDEGLTGVHLVHAIDNADGVTIRGEGYVLMDDTADVHRVVGLPGIASIDGTLLAGSADAGIGPFVVTVTVRDEDTNELVPSALVRLSRSGQARYGYTDGDGVIRLGCVAATWTVAIEAVGYAFTPTDLVVTGDTEEEFDLTPDVPTVPAEAGLSTGRILCKGTNGQPKPNVTIYAELITGDGVAGTSPSGHQFSFNSGDDGWAEYDGFMIGSTYAFWNEGGTRATKLVPDAASFLIPQIIGEP